MRNAVRNFGREKLMAQAPSDKLFADGAPITPDQFLTALPDAKLQWAGRDRYFVKAGRNGFVSDDRGYPIMIEVPRAR